MNEATVASALAQFGVAGMVGWMWLSERRAAAARERQLTEAHERLVTEREQTRLLVEVVRDNARALSALETGQAALRGLLEGMVKPAGSGSGGAAGAGAERPGKDGG